MLSNKLKWALINTLLFVGFLTLVFSITHEVNADNPLPTESLNLIELSYERIPYHFLNSVAWSPNSSEALIVGNQGNILRYDGTNISILKTNLSNTEEFWSVSWDPDGSEALIVSSKNLTRYVPVRLNVPSIGDNETIVFSDLMYSIIKVNTSSISLSSSSKIDHSPTNSDALITAAYDVVIYNKLNNSQYIVHHNDTPYYAAGWSQDGRTALVGGGRAGLWIYNASSQQFSREPLVEGVRDFVLYNTFFIFGDISWSPRDNFALVSYSVAYPISEPPGGASVVAHKLVRYDENGITTLTESVTQTDYFAEATGMLGERLFPSISWNNEGIAFLVSMWKLPFNETGPSYYNLFKYDGKNFTRLIPTIGASFTQVAWRPDGKQALFVAGSPSGDRIFLYVQDNSSIIHDMSPSINVTIPENQSQTFSVTPIGPTVIPPMINWFVNGNFVSNSTNYTFVSNYTSAGIYNITVNVSIEDISTSRSWNLTVVDVNVPPKILDIFPTTDIITIKEGENVDFNISAVDLDGQSITYEWFLDNIPVYLGEKYPLQTDYTFAGVHNITVVISDGVSSTTYTWLLNTTNVNRPPTITTIYPVADNLTITEIDNQTFNITAIDPDGTNLSVLWYLDGIVVSNETSHIFTGNYSSAGVHNVTVKVSDGELNATSSWNLTVTNVNRPPVIIDYSPTTNVSIKEGENITFSISVTDLDNQSFSCRWYINNNSVSTMNYYTLMTHYSFSGVHNITVIVSDGESNTTHTWNLTVINVNLKPIATIDSVTPNITKVGEEIILVGHGNDIDGAIIAYQWRTNATILGTNSTIKISNLSVGAHTIYFKVQDNDGNWSEEVSTTIEVMEKEKVEEKKAFIPFASFNVVIFNILILTVLVDLIQRRR